ncbi:Uncharacterised protein [uncultured archaeon]|nr:Uncharacterised protein [uncultured archaeon]
MGYSDAKNAMPTSKRMKAKLVESYGASLAASKVYGKDLIPEDIYEIADKYGQWQGYWAIISGQ